MRPVLAVKLTFLFFLLFFFSSLEFKNQTKIEIIIKKQNKTKKKATTPQKHFKYTSLSVSSLFYLLLFQKKRAVFIREFVLYFERDEKRNKSLFVSIGLLAKREHK